VVEFHVKPGDQTVETHVRMSAKFPPQGTIRLLYRDNVEMKNSEVKLYKSIDKNDREEVDLTADRYGLDFNAPAFLTPALGRSTNPAAVKKRNPIQMPRPNRTASQRTTGYVDASMGLSKRTMPAQFMGQRKRSRSDDSYATSCLPSKKHKAANWGLPAGKRGEMLSSAPSDTSCFLSVELPLSMDESSCGFNLPPETCHPETCFPTMGYSLPPIVQGSCAPGPFRAACLRDLENMPDAPMPSIGNTVNPCALLGQ